MGAPSIPIILTRPEGTNDALLAKLPPEVRDQLSAIPSPLIEIVLAGGPPELSEVDAVIFTSANGVRHAPSGAGRTAFCVGARTTDLARRQGWNAMQGGEDADGLVTMLGAEPPMRLLHIAGRHRRGEIDKRLAQRGHTVGVLVAYDQRLGLLTEEAHAALSGSPAPIVPLFSLRTAIRFAEQLLPGERFIPVAISKAVAGAVEKRSTGQVHIAQSPDLDEMARSIEKIVKAKAWVEGLPNGG